jgi:hypothetical protein
MHWSLITEYAAKLNSKDNLYEIYLKLSPERHDVLRFKSAAEFNSALILLAITDVIFNDEDKTIQIPYTRTGPQKVQLSNRV